MIPPTVGRVVHYYSPSYDPPGPLAAVIARVLSPELVTLGVFHPDGNTRGVHDVPLVQEDSEAPAVGHYCTWMPYQRGQAAKTEALENQLGAQTTAAALEELPADPNYPDRKTARGARRL